MFVSCKLFISVSYFFILARCEIPNLSVRKLDKSLIARKRLDTLDMCRIFTEENAKMQQYTNPKIIQSYNRGNVQEQKMRKKRNVDTKYAVNPALNEEDTKRVEIIVDKLYDDMEQRGEKVTYRQNVETTTVTITKPMNATKKPPSRRFDFAPAFLSGPVQPVAPMKIVDIPFVTRARWKHGIVPYFIDSKTYDAHLAEEIIKAFDYFEKATCIRLQKLRERPTDRKSLQHVNWLYITNPTGIRQCVHSNEKRKVDGVQMVVFGYDCMSLGDITHEVMHVLGFSHEHIRADRDQHVSILWDNIKPGYRKYFETAKTEEQYNLENLPYDYASVMHYPPRAFSRNGHATILTEPGVKIGQREGLSEIDVEKIGLIYSGECVSRNKEYLLKTCPSVVKPVKKSVDVTQKDIEDYFSDRLWPYGIVNYKLRDNMEFSIEERENINAVIRHIEKETCIKFRDVSIDENNEKEASEKNTENDTQIEEDPEKKDADKNSEEEVVHNYTTKKIPPIIYAESRVKSVTDNEIINIDEDKLDAIDDVPYDKSQIEKYNEDSSIPDLRRLTSKTNNEKKNTQLKANEINPGPRRVRRQAKSPANASRRHASNIMVLTRSPIPGCACPSPGKPSGNKVLEINADCFNSVNDLLHLFVHVLGLDHQHNMHDRDSYLHIVWKMLTPDIKTELQNQLPPAASAGFPYDYQSVMHYPWLQIKNGITNIMYPIWNDGWAMGHWQGLSSIDVQKLNLLYFSQCVARQKQGEL